jgi:hypothetical protein
VSVVAGVTRVTGLGLPRTAALRVLGNGVVPQQAAFALRLLGCPHRWQAGHPPKRSGSRSVSNNRRSHTVLFFVRHDAATLTLDAGIDTTVVSGQLGHSSSTLAVRLYHEHKMRQGYTRDAIDRKALALEGVLVPVTAQWNVELLKQAGFQQVDCFWRWMNFGGWIAVKPV